MFGIGTRGEFKIGFVNEGLDSTDGGSNASTDG